MAHHRKVIRNRKCGQVNLWEMKAHYRLPLPLQWVRSSVTKSKQSTQTYDRKSMATPSPPPPAAAAGSLLLLPGGEDLQVPSRSFSLNEQE